MRAAAVGLSTVCRRITPRVPWPQEQERDTHPARSLSDSGGPTRLRSQHILLLNSDCGSHTADKWECRAVSPHSSWAVPEAHLTPVKENHAVHAQSTRILLRSVLSTHGVQESPRSRDARTHHIHRARLGAEGPWGGDGAVGQWLLAGSPGPQNEGEGGQ